MYQKIKYYRLKKKLSQSDVASYLGVAKNTYYQYENGKRKFPLEALCQLADLFNVSVDELLGRKSEPELFDDARVEQPEILKLFNRLSPEQQNDLLNYVRGMVVAHELDQQKNENYKNKRA